MVAERRRAYEKNIPKHYQLPMNGLPGKWVMEANCSPETGDLFFSSKEFDRSCAIVLCSQCPVLFDCFKWALEHKPRGIWGGTTESERKALLREVGGVTSIDQ